jgi:hypothetical protein
MEKSAMFVAVKFNPSDVRHYTYTYSGAAEISPGDFVVVMTREGRKAVEVSAVDVQPPAFECKEIVAVLTEKGV